MTLQSLARRYCDEHPRVLSMHYVIQFKTVLGSYAAFLGQEPRLCHLNRELVNGYLAWLLDRGRSPWTAKTRRAILGVLGRYAVGEGLLDHLETPKLIHAPRLVPKSWTPEEIRRLVAAARALSGRFPKINVPRAPYMAGLILGLYDSGLRLGDALVLTRAQVARDGSFVARQSKTGREIVRGFSSAALAEIDASGAAGRGLIWPLWSARERLYRVVRILIAEAGVPRGSLRWLRRAGVTAICREHGLDAGRRFADHRSAATTLAHYVDQRQLGDVPQPPPLF